MQDSNARLKKAAQLLIYLVILLDINPENLPAVYLN